METKNAKEEKEKVKEMWYEGKKEKRHMFQIEVRKIKDNEEILYHYFVN